MRIQLLLICLPKCIPLAGEARESEAVSQETQAAQATQAGGGGDDCRGKAGPRPGGCTSSQAVPSHQDQATKGTHMYVWIFVVAWMVILRCSR